MTITIPPEALEAAQIAVIAALHLIEPDARAGELTMDETADLASAACLAMLANWPGMSTGPNIYNRRDAIIHLPVPEEPSDAES